MESIHVHHTLCVKKIYLIAKVCEDGKVKTKLRKLVGEGFPLVGRDTGPGKGQGFIKFLVFPLLYKLVYDLLLILTLTF